MKMIRKELNELQNLTEVVLTKVAWNSTIDCPVPAFVRRRSNSSPLLNSNIRHGRNGSSVWGKVLNEYCSYSFDERFANIVSLGRFMCQIPEVRITRLIGHWLDRERFAWLTDQQTDSPTEATSYRGALAHLKTLSHSQLYTIIHPHFPRPDLSYSNNSSAFIVITRPYTRQH